MKNINNMLSPIRFLTILGSAWVLTFGALARSDSGSQTESPPKLPYGVAEVLKLSQAKVGEGIISTYIQNSGTVYNLSPSDIVYLKEQGVSERIVNQMLDQQKKLAAAIAQPPSAVAPSQPAYTSAAPAPAPTSVAPAPTYVPSSTTYVISDPAPAYPYYGYSPYYYGPYYGGYYYPFFGFGFGYGRYGYYGGYRGGYRGYRGYYGGYRGGYGGYRGGGSHGGGHR